MDFPLSHWTLPGSFFTLHYQGKEEIPYAEVFMTAQTPVLVQQAQLSDQHSFALYLREIKKFPLLESKDEYILAKRWVEQEDRDAVHQLITSHLRLVAKIAVGYRGYGLPMSELVAEGNIGLMHAVKKFDPERGFRLSTYAQWWIKATIQEYILRSWSMVKIGTTIAQKRLFFSLKRLKNNIQKIAYSSGDLTDAQINQVAETLKVSPSEVSEMEQRMKGADFSLNAPLSQPNAEVSGEWQDWIADDRPTAEESLMHEDEFEKRKNLLSDAMTVLDEREIKILKARRLQETPETLDTLAHHHKISKERIRQIENAAFIKLQNHMKRVHSRACSRGKT